MAERRTRPRPARWTAPAVAALVIAVASAVGAGDARSAAADRETGAAGRPGVGYPKPWTFRYALPRILKTRVIHTRISTVRGANARGIGRSLASLYPTWVSGAIRYAKGQYPRGKEVRTYREIRRIVRTASPWAQFDVTLNADQYRTGAQIQRMMARVREKLDNDGWFFDFYSTAYHRRPRMIRAAIESAHAHGEFIGGNVFGLGRNRKLPLRSDFLAVQDFRLRLNLTAVRRLSRDVPVVYHLHNHPDHKGKGGCRFMQDWSTARRRSHIRNRARQQATFGFRVQYPALFPECKRHLPNGREILYSYNAFRDPPMARTIERLLNRYD